MKRSVHLALLLQLNLAVAIAQEPDVQKGATPAARPSPDPAGVLKSLGEGRFELGDIRLDRNAGTVSFPAMVNAWDGPIEYVLVHVTGKTHESILRTEVRPDHVHLAMLLLSETNQAKAKVPAKPASAETPAAAPAPIEDPPNVQLPGPPVSITVAWEVNGKKVERSAGALVRRIEGPSAIAREQWRYTGSQIENGIFLAQLEGSIVSLITDPSALINNVAEGHGNDEIWRADKEKLPTPKTPVVVTIKRLTVSKGKP